MSEESIRDHTTEVVNEIMDSAEEAKWVTIGALSPDNKVESDFLLLESDTHAIRLTGRLLEGLREMSGNFFDVKNNE